MLALCWHIFRSGASFFRSWTPLARLLGVVFATFDFFFAFWVAPGWIFGRPWTIWRLRLFVSPLQRAGTCEAHGIETAMCIFRPFLDVDKNSTSKKSSQGPKKITSLFLLSSAELSEIDQRNRSAKSISDDDDQ